MPESPRVESGELTADEILNAPHEGRRVIVQAELLGGVHKMTLRRDETVLYYDTSMMLYKHEDEDGMRACTLKMGYTKE